MYIYTCKCTYIHLNVHTYITLYIVRSWACGHILLFSFSFSNVWCCGCGRVCFFVARLADASLSSPSLSTCRGTLDENNIYIYVIYLYVCVYIYIWIRYVQLPIFWRSHSCMGSTIGTKTRRKFRQL